MHLFVQYNNSKKEKEIKIKAPPALADSRDSRRGAQDYKYQPTFHLEVQGFKALTMAVSVYYYWHALLRLSFLLSLAFSVGALNHHPSSSALDFSHQRLELDEQLVYDFYRSTCPNAERIVYQFMREAVANDSKIVAQLLRLMFHDCFIQVLTQPTLVADFHFIIGFLM